MNKEDESKVREIIKSVIEKELKSFEKQIIKTMDDKFLTKSQIKDLMINAYVKQHKFAWEKSKFITSYFNEL